MKLFLCSFMILCAAVVNAASREMVKYVPQNAQMLIGADFKSLRTCDLFNQLEKDGRVWSFNDRNDLTPYLKALNLNPTDIQSSLFAKYLNSYGAKGEFHLFEIGRDLNSYLESKPPTSYLGSKLYRLNDEEDLFGTMIEPSIIAIGSLNGVKMAVDVMQHKEKALKEGTTLNPLLDKVPPAAGVWGISQPLSRQEAASRGADQSTNAMLEAFQHYYFFGVPARSTIKSHFVGIAKGESEATFVRTFMIGMLTFAKLKAENQEVADALDQINVDRSGNNIHVSAVVNSSMVDAYLKGKLGVN
ncbi:hypothetical protein L0244_33545 [bacterium]|nr:hypothetical protein [bacterium]MCI0617924.1 hypothetical protein [bacterium]